MVAPDAVSLTGRTDARPVAMRFIADQVRRWPDLDLRPLITAGLDERDARLAQAICAETVRRWLTLESLLNTRLNRPLRENEVNLQAALLVGAAQIFFMDHQPDYAVVNEAVSWTKRRVRPKAGGLVNAVLRRMIDLRGDVREGRDDAGADVLPLSDGRWLALTQQVLPEDPLERVAFQTSHPVELIRRWARHAALPEVERVAFHDLILAPTLITGLDMSVIEGRAELTPHDEPGFAVWSGSHSDLVELLAAYPRARVQDPASYEALCRIRANVPSAALIADVCAGSGTKTAHLAQVFPEARLIAADVDRRRFELLRQRFARSEQVTVIEGDRLMDFAQQADLILFDVPCSNTATLARRVEAKYRVDAPHLNSLVSLQKQIIADHLALRAAGGQIAYSTCSMEPEENQAQVEWLNKWHKTQVITEFSQRPTGVPGDSPSRYRDGCYLAVVR